ncbi:hypothetical protein PTTG_11074, partial [Puccinia triticina 1-1 BBBD Race 1]
MFASYTSHFTKSAHSFNLAFQDGSIFNEGNSRGRSGRDSRQHNDDDNDNADDDDENDQKRKRKKKAAAVAAQSSRTGKPSNQEIYDKFLLAENALKKFEQNFNHHSQVHVDMVTVEPPPSLSL